MENKFFIEFDSNVRRIRGRCFISGFVPLIMILVLLANGAVVSETKTEANSGPTAKLEQRSLGRGPRILTDLTMLHRQGCLAKLLCGINVSETPSAVTSPLNDYAYMVKSIFEKFSIKGVAKSLLELRKSMKQQNTEGNGNTVKESDNKLEEKDDSTSSEHSEEDMQEDNDENSSFEDQLKAELAKLKGKINPSQLPQIQEYLKNRMLTLRNPRFDKTMYLNRKQKEFSMTEDDTRKMKIANEVEKRIGSARQCRGLGLLHRLTQLTLCPFEPTELQRIILKSSHTTTTTTTTTTPSPFSHKTHKFRRLLHDDEAEEDANLRRLQDEEEYGEESEEEDKSPIAVATKRMSSQNSRRENEAQRILNAMLHFGSVTNPFNNENYNLGSVSTSGFPYTLTTNQKGDEEKLDSDDDDEPGVRKKGKKGKGGNTENVRNPNIFHNENHVNIFSVHGYPKNKEKKSEEESEESEEEHHGWGWEKRKSAEHNRGRGRDQGKSSEYNRGRRREQGKSAEYNRGRRREQGRPEKHNNHGWGWERRKSDVHDHGWGWESPEESNESESEERKAEDENSTEIEVHNKSLLQPPGMTVALSMNPVFTVTNSHGSSGMMYPTLPKPPGLLPALPDAGGILPELPSLPKRTTTDEDANAFNTDTDREVDYTEDADAEPSTREEYEVEE